MFLKHPNAIEVVSEKWIVTQFQIDPNLGFKSELHCALFAEFHSQSCRETVLKSSCRLILSKTFEMLTASCAST